MMKLHWSIDLMISLRPHHVQSSWVSSGETLISPLSVTLHDVSPFCSGDFNSALILVFFMRFLDCDTFGAFNSTQFKFNPFLLVWVRECRQYIGWRKTSKHVQERIERSFRWFWSTMSDSNRFSHLWEMSSSWTNSFSSRLDWWTLNPPQLEVGRYSPRL